MMSGPCVEATTAGTRAVRARRRHHDVAKPVGTSECAWITWNGQRRHSWVRANASEGAAQYPQAP